MAQQDRAATHTVSVAIYGGPLDLQATTDIFNAAGTDASSTANHLGIAVHAAAPAPPSCRSLHHARSPSQIRFIYDPRPAQPFFGRDPVLRGRCELAALTELEAARADAVLAAHGADDASLPWFGQGNCHDWTAGAVRALEAEGLAGAGAGAFWTAMIGKGPVGMMAGWEARGGVVVRNAGFAARSGREADARWATGEEVEVGRLGEGRKAALAALLDRKGRDASREMAG